MTTTDDRVDTRAFVPGDRVTYLAALATVTAVCDDTCRVIVLDNADNEWGSGKHVSPEDLTPAEGRDLAGWANQALHERHEHRLTRESLARTETALREIETVSTANLERLQQRIDQRDAKIEEIRQRMISESDSRGWCSEFDDILEELGLEGRKHTWNVEVTVTLTRTVSVEASTDDAASEGVEGALGFSEYSDVRVDGEYWTVSDISTGDVERA